MRRLAIGSILLAGALVALAQAPAKGKPRKASAPFDEKLPMLGVPLSDLPAGTGKVVAESACLKCHSADMLRQQRLTEKQWSTNLTKMIGWGAEVPDDKKDELVAYLVKNFGPDNDRFAPIVVRPVGR